MQNAKAGLDNDRNCSHCLLCSYGSYFLSFRETVEAIMNAAYPGKRIGVGGESGWENIVLWLGNLFYPMFGEGGIRETVVEDAGFFALFPVCYIPAFLLRFREKQKDKLLGILGVISIVFGIYCFIGFPSVLAKITLLSFSFDKRTMVILEFVRNADDVSGNF